MAALIVPYPDISVEYSENEGSPSETMTAESFRATRTLICAWEDRLTLAAELLAGYSVTVGALQVDMGRLYPHWPSVYVVGIDGIEPYENGATTAYEGDETVAAHAQAKITVRYENRQFDPQLSQGTNGNNFLQIAEESVASSSQFLVLPEGQSIYLNTSPRTEIPSGSYPGKIIRGAQWNYTLNQVRSVPGGWFTYAGYVNESAVTSNSLGVTFATETLLFLGVQLTRTITVQGPQAWRAALSFAHRPDGWNMFPDSYGAFYALYDAASGGSQKKPYPATNFVTNLNLVT